MLNRQRSGKLHTVPGLSDGLQDASIFTGCGRPDSLNNGPFEANQIKKTCLFAFLPSIIETLTSRRPTVQVVSQPAVQFDLHPQCLQCSVGCHPRPRSLAVGVFCAPQPFRYQKQSMEPHHLGIFSMTRTLQKEHSSTSLKNVTHLSMPHALRFFHSKVLRSCMVWHPFGRHRSTISGPPSSQRNMYQRQKTMWQNQQRWRKSWKSEKNSKQNTWKLISPQNYGWKMKCKTVPFQRHVNLWWKDLLLCDHKIILGAVFL